jgi:hypothetical protein
VNNSLNGFGFSINKEKDLYIGYFFNQKKKGEGKIYYSNGEVYEG